VVGATQSQITFLSELEPDLMPESAEADPSDEAPDSFARLLKRVGDQVRPRRLSLLLDDPRREVGSQMRGSSRGSSPLPPNRGSSGSSDGSLASGLLDTAALIRAETDRLRRITNPN
jgi:hypothetical protein